MIKVKISEAEGRTLDYLFALYLKWCWVKNASRRSGDSNRRSNEPVQWPIGARFFIEPDHYRGVNAVNVNWDGWLLSSYNEPIAPAAFYNLPKWSIHQCKKVINEAEDLNMTIQPSRSSKGEWRASTPKSWFETRVSCFQYGDTMIEAAMRCMVASRFGKCIGIEDDIYDSLMKL